MLYDAIVKGQPVFTFGDSVFFIKPPASRHVIGDSPTNKLRRKKSGAFSIMARQRNTIRIEIDMIKGEGRSVVFPFPDNMTKLQPKPNFKTHRHPTRDPINIQTYMSSKGLWTMTTLIEDYCTAYDSTVNQLKTIPPNLLRMFHRNPSRDNENNETEKQDWRHQKITSEEKQGRPR